MSAPLSRRDFLAASALGTLGALRLPHMDTTPDEGALLWIGTYTEPGRRDGIFIVRMDPRTSALRRTGAVDAGENPSFLALHPDGRTLYAVNETTEREGKPSGGVTALRVTRGSGTLARLNEVASEGGAPCYVSVTRDGRTALVANYVGGNVSAFALAKDGRLAPAADVERHEGATGPHRERQQAPHAHCIRPDPTGRWALAVDLGLDRVIVYAIEGSTLRRAGDVAVKPGAGPRHVAFHPTLPLAYVANELDSTVTVLAWDAKAGTLAARVSASTLPAGWTGHNQVADIHVDDAGRTLYVSNRGHDSIAVFTLDAAGAPAQAQVVPTEGHWPRNFAIAPGGRWVLVANERSNSVVVLSRDLATGRLASTGTRLEVPKPVCVRFA